MSSLQINKLGEKLLGSKWIGVFPLNRIPVIRNGGMVINNQSEDLPGEHWIAVYIDDLTVSVFDPLGQVYPALLVSKIMKTRKKIVFNRIMYQDPFSQTCGQHCISWLYKQANN